MASTLYIDRPAAYAVITNADGLLAVVQGPSGRLWLPGGGSLPEETAETTVVREVREELGYDMRLLSRIGEAVESFHAADEDRHYHMNAVFFRAELTNKLASTPEHELIWILPNEAASRFFHECHAWAVDRAVTC